ncbi:MAG: MFS transporter [Flavobacteriales bacterium]
MSSASLAKNDKRVIRAWILFDWANSVFQLSITSAIFPAYYVAVTSLNEFGYVRFFGQEVINTSLYAWTISASFLFVAFLSPLFSAMADYTGRRKMFMKIFTWIGVIGVALMSFFDGKNIEFGIVAFFLGGLGYSGSLVFYNSFLPIIATIDCQDKVSARGYAWGYIGGIIMLLINLLLILNFEKFGFSTYGHAIRFNFLLVAIWWIGFAQITFAKLPKYVLVQRKLRRPLREAYTELRVVWNEFSQTPILKRFLFSFFFISMGVLTVMYMAANYGKKELKLDDTVLIPTILIIQFVGVAGAFFFARLSQRYGNLPVLMFIVSNWIVICVGAWFVQTAGEFMILAFFVGLVMGGVQSLCRSTFSKMLPETRDHTSYFSFYDVVEKLSAVSGTFVFGIIESITRSMRDSIVSLCIFFVIGFAGLLFTAAKFGPKGSLRRT